jgi:hypothetical protein
LPYLFAVKALFLCFQVIRSEISKPSKMSSKLNPSAAAFVPASADADFELVSTPIAEPDKKAFAYPFSCISTGEEESWCLTYDTDDFCTGLLGEEKDGLTCGKFPDNIVEFYTDRYVEQPLIIKGAGAGAAVTASVIFADIVRIGNV